MCELADLALDVADGIGVSGAEAQSGDESTTLASASAGALVNLRRDGGTAVYVLAGVSVLHERAEDAETGVWTATGSCIDLGLGGTFGSWFDARLTYSFVMNTENVAGIVGVLAGVVF